MNGHSALNIFTQQELELHRAATTLVERLPEVSHTRCHELTRAVGIIFRRNPLKVSVVDGTFGLASHSWLVTRQPNRHIILDVYSVGSIPMVQLHDAGTLSVRDARAYIEGPPRDDVDVVAINTLLSLMEWDKSTPIRSPL